MCGTVLQYHTLEEPHSFQISDGRVTVAGVQRTELGLLGGTARLLQRNESYCVTLIGLHWDPLASR